MTESNAQDQRLPRKAIWSFVTWSLVISLLLPLRRLPQQPLDQPDLPGVQ